MSTATDTALGTHSEVGKLRTVMVHRPDLAHERLSPTNCHELLFDDVIWVRRARQEFDAFTDLMRERGVDSLVVHRRHAYCQPSPRLFCNDTKSLSRSACPSIRFCCAVNCVRWVSIRSISEDAPAP